MNTPKPGAEWRPNAAGVLVPPGHAPAAHVERAEFAVKVKGFAPEPKGWDGRGYSSITVMQKFYEVPVAKPRKR